MYFTCFLKFSRTSIITARYFITLFDPILVSPTITSIFFTIFQPLNKTAYVLCAASVKPASSSQVSTFRIPMFVFSSIFFTVFATETTAMSSTKSTIVDPFGNCSRCARNRSEVIVQNLHQVWRRSHVEKVSHNSSVTTAQYSFLSFFALQCVYVCVCMFEALKD